MARFGGVPHNKGVYAISQDGLLDGWKRCNVCKMVLEASYFQKGTGYLGRRADCKRCQNAKYRRSICRNLKEPVQDERLSYFTIKYDPTGTFERGVRFPAWDFMESLKGNVWPVGMIVEKEPEQVLMVVGTRLITIEEAYANQEDNDGAQENTGEGEDTRHIG